MAVRCSKCGEELLGPVNRCWKCGQQFSAQAETGGLPPVRYAPVNLPPDVVQAEFADGGVVTAVPGADSTAAAAAASASSPASFKLKRLSATSARLCEEYVGSSKYEYSIGSWRTPAILTPSGSSA